MRRVLLLTVCLVLASAATWVAPRVVQAQQAEVILSIDGLIFENPDEASRVLMRVRSGERFPVLSEQGAWVQVQLPRGTGWVLGKIVRRDGEAPPIAGFGDVKAERITIIDEYADVKAGPGDAYLGTRRAFRGDTFVVAQRSEDGDWVQVRIDGELGWIRSDQTMAAAAVEARPGGGGGGGGGKVSVGALDEGDPDLGIAQPGGGGGGGGGDTGFHVEARLHGNFQLAQQYFASNTLNPRVQQYTAKTNMAGTGLFARAWFLDYLGASLEYDLNFGAPIEVPFFGGQTAQISNTAHRFIGSLTARFPFASGKRVPWVGVTGGYLLHRFSIQELQFEEGGPPLFLTNTYTGVRTAVEGNLPLGPVDLWASGWLVLAPGFAQENYTSGNLATTQFYGAEVGAAYEFSEGFGFFLRGIFDNYDTSFSGPATRDPGITGAVNQDRFLSLSTGVLWRPL